MTVQVMRKQRKSIKIKLRRVQRQASERRKRIAALEFEVQELRDELNRVHQGALYDFDPLYGE